MPIVFWDERFSTAVVTRALIANDVSRARRAQIVDKMAAAYILQGALDRLGGSGATTGTVSLLRAFSTLLWMPVPAIIVENGLFFDSKWASYTLQTRGKPESS